MQKAAGLTPVPYARQAGLSLRSKQYGTVAGVGIDLPEAYSGQGMPYLMGTIVNEIFSSSNQSLAIFQGLTHGATSAILTHGTEAQKATYLWWFVAGPEQ